jgi:hypothetical protein
LLRLGESILQCGHLGRSRLGVKFGMVGKLKARGHLRYSAASQLRLEKITSIAVAGCGTPAGVRL